MREDGVGDAQVVEDFECTGLDTFPAGALLRRRRALDDTEGNAAVRQLGKCQPGRTSADDQNFCVNLGHR